MSALQSLVERLIARVKADATYQMTSSYSNRQLATMLWIRGMQCLRGMPLTLHARNVHGPVFRGHRVVIEHAYQLTAAAGLVLEDGAYISALSATGVVLGRNVTIARGAILTCTGVLAKKGDGIRIGDRSAIGAGAFVGGQGGVTIGSDVIMGAGVRVFSENHNFDALDRPIRTQGETRRGVTIGDDCWIGAGVTIVDGVSIGTGCVIAAGAVVTRDIPPESVAVGVPARRVRSRRVSVRAEVLQESARAAALPVRPPQAERALREDR